MWNVFGWEGSCPEGVNCSSPGDCQGCSVCVFLVAGAEVPSFHSCARSALFIIPFQPWLSEPRLLAEAACQSQSTAGPQFPNVQFHSEVSDGLRSSSFSSLPLCCPGTAPAWAHREELLRPLWRDHTKTLPESGYIRNQIPILTQGNPFNSETGKSVLFYAGETRRRYYFLGNVINYAYWSE